MRISLRSAAVAAVMPLLLAACASPDEPTNQTTTRAAEPAPTSSPSESPTSSPAGEPDAGGAGSAAAQAAIDGWLAAFFAGQADDTCALMTAKYGQTYVDDWNAAGLGQPVGTCEEAISAAIDLAESYGSESDASDFTSAVVESGSDTAAVEISFGNGRAPETYVVVLVDGRWLVDEQVF